MDEYGPGGRCSLYVDIEGELRLIGAEPSVAGGVACQRFSLRRCGIQHTGDPLRRDGPGNRWDPFKHASKFQNSDEVLVFCHSMGFGPYANLRRPPNVGVPVRWLHDSNTLSLNHVSLQHDRIRSIQSRVLQAEYDIGTMASTSQEHCERAGFVSAADSNPANPPPNPKAD